MDIGDWEVEIAIVKLQKGLEEDSISQMRLALSYALTHFSQDIIETCVRETHHIFKCNGISYRRINMDELLDVYVPLNVRGYINTIDLVLADFPYCNKISFIASEVLFGENSVRKKFENTDVLYVKDGNQLNVKGLLDVCSYAVRVGELISPGNKFILG